MKELTKIELTEEEMNVIRNSLGYLLLLNKKHPNTVTLSPISKVWNKKIINKFDKLMEGI